MASKRSKLLAANPLARLGNCGRSTMNPAQFLPMTWPGPTGGAVNPRGRRAVLVHDPDPRLLGEVVYRGIKEGI